MSRSASVSGAERRAVVVRGGWPGHVPVEATDRFIPFLQRSGFTVEVHGDLDVYADGDAMAGVDLVVQCWSDGDINSTLPHPPDGSVAGGPNSDTGTWDPVAQANLQGCAPQFCYVDDIQSWSTNEITINWSSALSWVASFVADQGDGERQRRGRSDPRR